MGKMIDYDNQVFKRVLRKRKIAPETVVKDFNGTVEYNVLSEHSYFRAVERKNCRWPMTKLAPKNPTQTLMTNTTDCIRNGDQLPDYLRGYESSSDEEDENDEYQNKSLSQLIKLEVENELKSKKLKNSHPHKKLLPFDTTLLNLYPNTIFKTINYHSSNTRSEIEPDKNLNHSSSSQQDSERSISGDCTIGVENPKQTIQIVSTYSMNTSVPENQNVNESPSMPIGDSSNNCTLEKSNGKNISTSDDLVSNDLLPNSIDRSGNSPSVCTNNVTESGESEGNSESLNERPIVINSSSLTENFSPPFDWYHIIYLAIKNSTNEHVTCQEIQHFSRRWFPFYGKRSWTRVIDTTLNHYKDTFFVSFSFSIAFDHIVWTVKKKSVHTLELKLVSVVENFENAIKSSMKNPDQLSLLLKGYGVFNLGYKT